MADMQQFATNYLQPGVAGDCAGKRFYPLFSAVASSATVSSVVYNVVIGNFAWIVAGASTLPVTITPTKGTNTQLTGLVVREKPLSNPTLGFGTEASMQVFTGQSCQYTTQAVKEIVIIQTVSGSITIGSPVYADDLTGGIVLSATTPTGATKTNYIVAGLIGAYGGTNTFAAGQLITISNTSNVMGA